MSTNEIAARKYKNRAVAERTRAILVERFPKTFVARGQEKRPLKVGIAADILSAMPEIGRKALAVALEDYTWGPTYCRQVIAGAARVDLSGEPAGVVTESEAEFAAGKVQMFTKRHKPTEEDRGEARS